MNIYSAFINYLVEPTITNIKTQFLDVIQLVPSTYHLHLGLWSEHFSNGFCIALFFFILNDLSFYKQISLVIYVQVLLISSVPWEAILFGDHKYRTPIHMKLVFTYNRTPVSQPSVESWMLWVAKSTLWTVIWNRPYHIHEVLQVFLFISYILQINLKIMTIDAKSGYCTLQTSKTICECWGLHARVTQFES
jgi:hypothetical protein